MSDAKASGAGKAFMEEFPRLDDRGQRLFTEVLQDLFLHCYIIRGGLIRANPHYTFIERHEDLIKAYLALGGWRLHLDSEQGVARLYHPEGSGRIHFNKDETILILVLRLIYHEQKQAVSESMDTVVRVGMVRERLHALLPPSMAKVFLGKKIMGRTLRRLEHLQILRFDGGSFQINDETRVIVLASIEHLVSQQGIEGTQERLRNLLGRLNGGELDEAT